jgi:hypothetical protein
MVVPMKGQHEQHYNAAALDQMGIPVLKKVKPKHFHKITSWIENPEKIMVDYRNITEEAVKRAFELLR